MTPMQNDDDQNRRPGGTPVERDVRPRALLLTHRDGRETLHPMSEYAVAYRDTAVGETMLYDSDVIDRLNSELLDLALLIGRLIHRMRAARDGRGIASGDEALEQQAIGYLKRKGLLRPLREEGPNG